MKDFESCNFFRLEYVFLRYLHKKDIDYSSQRSLTFAIASKMNFLAFEYEIV